MLTKESLTRREFSYVVGLTGPGSHPCIEQSFLTQTAVGGPWSASKSFIVWKERLQHVIYIRHVDHVWNSSGSLTLFSFSHSHVLFCHQLQLPVVASHSKSHPSFCLGLMKLWWRKAVKLSIHQFCRITWQPAASLGVSYTLSEPADSFLRVGVACPHKVGQALQPVASHVIFGTEGIKDL